MKLTFLGTGTSTGVPQMLCTCDTCISSDPRDKRLRTSALLQLDDGRNILIDAGPDLRTQILRVGSPDIAAVLLTHSHYDHVGGIDDLRPYCHALENGHLPVYCQSNVAKDLRDRVPYCFAEKLYPGVPTFALNEVIENEPFDIGNNVIIEPLRIMHYRLPVLGYRIGNLAYITDCKTIPTETLDKIHGIDTLIINALRHKEHISHMNLQEALDAIARIEPRQTYLTHLGHDMGRHADTESILPSDVAIAYDNLTINIQG